MTEVYRATNQILKRNEVEANKYRRKTEQRQHNTVRDTLTEILLTGDSNVFGNILNEYQRLLLIDPKSLTQIELNLQSQINDKLTFNFGLNGAEFIVREWIQKPPNKSK